MNYEQSIEVIKNLTKFGINLGLSRIRSLLKKFNNPQDTLPIIHIGGTNGKGSTAALLTAVLQEAGYKVGTYTSPHLHSYNERICINGEPISSEDLAETLTRLVPAFEEVKQEIGESPTEFEVLTALAFLYFHAAEVEIVILEVGLGGDMDSTNVIQAPLLSIITNVTVDHTAYLGTTVKEIAEKKSGIIKKKCPIITASTDDVVLKVLQEQAQKLAAPFYQVQQEVTYKILEKSLKGQLCQFKTTQKNYGELFLSLKGDHQLVNAATALLALELIKVRGFQTTDDDIKRGFVNVQWPGRLETINENPLVIIDGAHNIAGMKALTQWLKEIKVKVERIILVIGMLDDKDRKKVAYLLEPLVDRIIVTKPDSYRAQKWWEIKDFFQQKQAVVSLKEEVPQALQEAVEEAGSHDLVLVTGSLYLLGEVRKFFNCQ